MRVNEDQTTVRVPTIGDSITQIREILANRSAGDLPGGLLMDTFSAGAIVSVYDALGPATREKFDAMSVLQGQSVAFRLIEKMTAA